MSEQNEGRVSDERLAEIVARYHDPKEPFAEEVGSIALELQSLRSPPAEIEAVAWRPIATHSDHFGVLVSRTPDKYIYGPLAAFVDVTGVWRVLGSEGGMTELPFEPTHWMPLPRHVGATAASPAHPQGEVGTENADLALRAAAIASEMLEALKLVNDIVDEALSGREDANMAFARIIDAIGDTAKKASGL